MATAAGNLPIQLLHDRVLVSLDREAGERRSTTGIVIPDSSVTPATAYKSAARSPNGPVCEYRGSCAVTSSFITLIRTSSS